MFVELSEGSENKGGYCGQWDNQATSERKTSQPWGQPPKNCELEEDCVRFHISVCLS